jgi:thiol:disulfide interchange protein DsbC
MNHVIAAVRRTAAGLVGLAAGAALYALAYGQTPPANPQTPAANPQAPTASPQPPTANAARSPEAANIKKLLEQRFEGVSIGNISKTPYFGLYEVQFDEQIVYTDAKVTYILVGSIYDAATRKNLTEARQREYSRVAFDALPLELAFKRVKGNGARKLALFSDPDCPFCARIEQELKNIDNVTIYTFLYPIDQLHPDASRKSRMIWCALDPVAAWNQFFASGALPKNNGDCENPVAATAALGQKLRVSATPTLIFADGSVIPGALPAAQLEAEITQGEAEAKRLATKK